MVTMNKSAKSSSKSLILTKNNQNIAVKAQENPSVTIMRDTSIHYDNDTNIYYFESPHTIIHDDNDILLELSNDQGLMINGGVHAHNAHFIGDVNATNSILLGDLFTTNATVTSDLSVARKLVSQSATILDDMQVNNFLTVGNGIYAKNIKAEDGLKSDIIETMRISSVSDLELSTGVNRTILMPNFKNSICENVNLIEPTMIKSSKIFLISENVMINADISCDGMEIIIINKNIYKDTVIRDHRMIIVTLISQTSCRIIFIAGLGKWLVV
jgi:hypothetical protein